MRPADGAGTLHASLHTSTSGSAEMPIIAGRTAAWPHLGRVIPEWSV